MSDKIMIPEKIQLPTLSELVADTEMSLKQNNFMVLLNQPPPDAWLRQHPMAKTKNDKGQDVPASYLPINRVEYLLSRLFVRWWVEILSTSVMANSVSVTVRVHVINPVTMQEEWNDGVGACMIQTEKGAGAMDWNAAKSAGVMMALPAAKSYAVKDAAESWGKLFGKDLNRRDVIVYDTLLKSKVSEEDLFQLFEMKKSALTDKERKNALRILNDKEKNSYEKLFNELKSK